MTRARVVAGFVVAVACACRQGDGRAAQVRPQPDGGAPRTTSAVVDTPQTSALRRRLVARIAAGGVVRDSRVLQALRDVPRHRFVPEHPPDLAYADAPLPIGYEQTISQPTVVAHMTEALSLSGRERVLEIGTGSGYQAAVLGRLAREVYSIELLAPLAERARAVLAALGHANVRVRAGDGYRGWPEHAPFDRIVLTAAPPEVPQALFDQLAEGGILVAPVGEEGAVQRLVRYRKSGGAVSREELGLVRFVPMVPGAPPGR